MESICKGTLGGITDSSMDYMESKSSMLTFFCCFSLARVGTNENRERA